MRLSVGGSAVDQESFNELSQVDLGDGGGKTTRYYIARDLFTFFFLAS